MNRDALPPLLRGLGATIILVATVIAFVVARRDLEFNRSWRRPFRQQSTASHPANTTEALAQDVQQIKAELGDHNIVEEVLENPWFEWLGIIGTAVFSSSFYVEALLKAAMKKRDSSDES